MSVGGGVRMAAQCRTGSHVHPGRQWGSERLGGVMGNRVHTALACRRTHTHRYHAHTHTHTHTHRHRHKHTLHTHGHTHTHTHIHTHTHGHMHTIRLVWPP